MLRTTANQLWTRVVPAARQAYPAAGVATQRTFAAAAADDDAHAPPLNLFGLPARYAAALYTAGSKAGNLATVQAEFKTVSHPDNPHRVAPHGRASGAREPTPWRNRSDSLAFRLCLDFIQPPPPS